MDTYYDLYKTSYEVLLLFLADSPRRFGGMYGTQKGWEGILPQRSIQLYGMLDQIVIVRTFNPRIF